MPHTQTALIIDDERDIRELLVMTLGRMGLAVDTAADIASAERQLASRRYDLCFTDMRLPDGSGQQIIELIAQRHPELPVAMITAHGNVDAAVQALKAGAFDFVSKPVDLNVLRQLVQNALQQRALRSDNQRLQEALDGQRFGSIIGACDAMRDVYRRVDKVAATDFSSGKFLAGAIADAPSPPLRGPARSSRAAQRW